MTQWLLGQAAFGQTLPVACQMGNALDTTAPRGTTTTVPESETQHLQGNVYPGVEAFADADGMDRREVDRKRRYQMWSPASTTMRLC